MRDFQFIIIVFVLITFCNKVNSQDRFNERISLGFNNLAFTGVVSTDSCYYLTGIAVDSVAPYNFGSVFASIDLNGSINFIKTYLDFSEGTFESWFPVMTLIDTALYNVGQLVLSSEKALAIFVSYNLAGDTIIFNKFCSVTEDTTWTTGRDFIQYDDTTFYLLMSDLVNERTQYNFSLVRTDQSGNKIWQKLPFPYASSLQILPASFIKDTDGTILILNTLSNEPTAPKNFVCRDLLIRVDTSGSVIDTWYSPPERLQGRYLSDLIKTSDGGYAFTSGIGEEIGDSLAPYHMMSYNAGICKLNENLEEQWFKTFGNPASGGHYTCLKNLLELEDGSFVSAGSYFETLEQPVHIDGYEDLDYYNINGFLVKVSSNGDSIWARQYHFVESPGDDHGIYDFKVANDGGYILCGEAIDFYNHLPPAQQGWIIKTDEYGCIVPGCQNGIQDDQENISPFLIYPNPAYDFVNIYNRVGLNQNHTDAVGRIIDLSANVLIEFSMFQSDLTYIIPVNNFPTGVYLFQYITGNCVQRSEKILIINR